MWPVTDISCLPDDLTGATLTRGMIDDFASQRRLITLNRCNLEGLDLAGADLTAWQFKSCNLIGTDFSDGRLEMSSFLSCRAVDVVFDRAMLDHACLRSTTFTLAQFVSAKLNGASAEFCDFTGANFTSAFAKGFRSDTNIYDAANFSRARFDGGDIQRSDLSRTATFGAGFKGARFTECKLPSNVRVA